MPITPDFRSRIIDRPQTKVMIFCLDYYLKNRRSREAPGLLYEKLHKKLRDFFLKMAHAHAEAFDNCEADTFHPGYIIKESSFGYLRIPYYLASTFPTNEDLDCLWQLARHIKSGNRSIISLSGSNVIRVMFDVTGDIDFCEYFPQSDYEGITELAGKINKIGDLNLTCMKISVASNHWQYPWINDRPTPEILRSSIDHLQVTKSTIFYEYIVSTRTLGVSEVSNLVIFTDDSWNSAGNENSFIFQEAPIGSMDWLPGDLSNPIEFGRYLHWLTRQIQTLAAIGDTRKCLKRCASLSRVLFLSDISNRIIRLVESSSAFVEGKIRESEKLILKLDALQKNELSGYINILRLQTKTMEELLKATGEPSSKVRRDFEKAVQEIAGELLDYVYGPSQLDVSERDIA